MASNSVNSYQRRIHGKLVTVSPYSRKAPTGREGIGGRPKKESTSSTLATKKSTPKESTAPEWMKSQVRNLTQFDNGPQLNAALESIVTNPKLGAVVVFPNQEVLTYALNFAKSKGLAKVWGIPIQKLFVLPENEASAREILYDALKKEVTTKKEQLSKKVPDTVK